MQGALLQAMHLSFLQEVFIFNEQKMRNINVDLFASVGIRDRLFFQGSV